ncbi:MAG: HAD family hydrolase [Myxococcales bacterium]|nr:HAD family hydrolase [Myxococcales bacterium]
MKDIREEPLIGSPEAGRGVFVNRTLNMKQVKAIGYDMDYTLVHYDAVAWEERAYLALKKRLLDHGWDAPSVQALEFDPNLAVRGLVVDTQRGNLLKVNRFGYIKAATHGCRRLSGQPLRAQYDRPVIDSGDQDMVYLDTLFSLSEGCIFAQLVDIYDQEGLPGCHSYAKLWETTRESLDQAHIEGALKRDVIAQPERYIQADPMAAQTLLDQKRAGKKLLLITNSEWGFVKPVMDHAYGPYLPEDMPWEALFDLIIVESRKPGFFQGSKRMFEICGELLRPVQGSLETGKVYLGGDAEKVEAHLGLSGDDILYVGDHVYGDVIVSKSRFKWRTCVVLRELEKELEALADDRGQQGRINELMRAKELLENESNDLRLLGLRDRATDETRARREQIRLEVEGLDSELGEILSNLQRTHPSWGHMMRAGNDESLLAQQVERYACIYTSRVSNLGFYTPFKYFRAPRLAMPHDQEVGHWFEP